MASVELGRCLFCLCGGVVMREEYDFTNARKNPFAKKKKQITINIDASTIEYFNLIQMKKPYFSHKQHKIKL